MQKQIVLSVMNKAIEIRQRRMSLKDVVYKMGLMPKGVVLLGIAEDGLPVLLHARDSKAPNIIIWNRLARQGLRILKVIAEYLFSHHKSDKIEFVVFTRNPGDWGELNDYGFGTNSNTACIGIIPIYSELAEVVMRGLARWANESHKSAKAPVILMIDDMENLESASSDFKLNLRYILLRGREKHLYSVGTSNKNNFHKVQQWLDGFQREIYGQDVEDTFEYVEGKEGFLFYTPKTELI